MNAGTYVTKVLLVGASILLFASCSERKEMTYEECLLQNGKQTKLPEALVAVKSACKGRFPKVFNFDEIADKAAVAKWAIVAAKTEFVVLDDAAKSDAREQYFEAVIRPRVQPDYVEDANVEFDAFSRRIEKAIPSLSAPISRASNASVAQ